MDLKLAREILKPPLVFGDARQIEAHEFLVQVEEAKDALRACQYSHDVLSNKFSLAGCVCTAVFKNDVRLAAAEDFIEEQKRKP